MKLDIKLVAGGKTHESNLTVPEGEGDTPHHVVTNAVVQAVSMQLNNLGPVAETAPFESIAVKATYDRPAKAKPKGKTDGKA